jgi:hypothetical protein
MPTELMYKVPEGYISDNTALPLRIYSHSFTKSLPSPCPLERNFPKETNMKIKINCQPIGFLLLNTPLTREKRFTKHRDNVKLPPPFLQEQTHQPS